MASQPRTAIADFLSALRARAGAEGATLAFELPREAIAAAVETALARHPPSDRVQVRDLAIELRPGAAHVHARVRARLVVALESEASIVLGEPAVEVRGEDVIVAFRVLRPLRFQKPGMDFAAQMLAGLLPRGSVDPRVVLQQGARLEVPIRGALAAAGPEWASLLARASVRRVELLEGRARVELSVA